MSGKPIPPKTLDNLTELFRSGPISACVLVKGEMAFLGKLRECFVYVETSGVRKYKILHLKKVFEAEQANQ